jgi:SAM-dependent methyltransferase
MSSPPRLFDRDLLRIRLDRAAPGYANADFLKRRAAEDAVVRLEAIMRDFPVAVDLGARNGAFREALAQSDAAERVGLVVEADLSARMLEGRTGPRLVADEERLPFAPGSLDLVISTLALHWANDVVGALIQIRRALKPDGLFIGAFLGGATLTELRQSLLTAEAELTGGAGPRISPFADAYDAAGLLQRSGFALPVADVGPRHRPLCAPAQAPGRPARHGRDQHPGRASPQDAHPAASSPAPSTSTPSASPSRTAACPPPSRSSPSPAGPAREPAEASQARLGQDAPRRRPGREGKPPPPRRRLTPNRPSHLVGEGGRASGSDEGAAPATQATPPNTQAGAPSLQAECLSIGHLRPRTPELTANCRILAASAP